MVKGVARRVIMVNSPEPNCLNRSFFWFGRKRSATELPIRYSKRQSKLQKSCMHKQNGAPTHDIWPTVLSLFCGGGIASLIWSICIFF